MATKAIPEIHVFDVKINICEYTKVFKLQTGDVVIDTDYNSYSILSLLDEGFILISMCHVYRPGVLHIKDLLYVKKQCVLLDEVPKPITIQSEIQFKD